MDGGSSWGLVPAGIHWSPRSDFGCCGGSTAPEPKPKGWGANSLTYTFSHNHGSQKWDTPLVVTFQITPFSTSMIMGEIKSCFFVSVDVGGNV